MRLRGLKASLGYLENSGQLGLHCNMKTQNQNKKAERASVSHCEEEACAEGRTGGSPAAQGSHACCQAAPGRRPPQTELLKCLHAPVFELPTAMAWGDPLPVARLKGQARYPLTASGCPL